MYIFSFFKKKKIKTLKCCFEAFRGSRGLIHGGQTTTDPPPPCISHSDDNTWQDPVCLHRLKLPRRRVWRLHSGTVGPLYDAAMPPYLFRCRNHLCISPRWCQARRVIIDTEWEIARAKCRLKRPLVALLSPGALSGKKLIELARRGNYSANGNNCVLQPASSACASHTRTPFIYPFETSLETTHSTGSCKDKCGRLARTKRGGGGDQCTPK